jgi:hypothetical protein
MSDLLIFAATLFIVGVITIATSRSNWRLRQRVIATPTSPIARSGDDEVVEIKGTAVASEQGTLQAPFSGRAAVFCRITVQERRSTGKSSHWHTVFEEVHARDFDIEDASGQQARIRTLNAKCVLDKRAISTSGIFDDPPPELVAFLQSRNVDSETWLGTNKRMQFLEEVIAPGEAVYAMGPAQREAGPDPYHNDAPASRLVLRNAGEGELELLISNKSEDELVRHLGAQLSLGVALIVASLIVGLAALAVW